MSLAPSPVTHFLTYPNFFFSLFGTFARNASLLSTYAFYLAWSIGLQIVLDVAQLILFFRESRQTLIHNCIDGSTDKEVQNICNNSFNASKWSIVVSMVIGLLIQFCEFSFLLHRCEMSLLLYLFISKKGAAYIIASYAKKLENEKSWRSGPGVTPLHDTSRSKYTHVHQQDDHHHGANVPLTASYAYGDTSHSFGGSKPHHHDRTAVLAPLSA